MERTGNKQGCLARGRVSEGGRRSLFRRCRKREAGGLPRPSERYWALEELCQCYPCGLATFNNRSLDLRRQKCEADEAAAIWRIRRRDEHGQSGIILVQHGVCGAERPDQNRVWPVSRTWALENPGLAATLDKGQMQPGETRIHRIRLDPFVRLEALADRDDPVDRQQAVQRPIVEFGAGDKRDGIIRTSRDHATQHSREVGFERWRGDTPDCCVRRIAPCTLDPGDESGDVLR